jgi:hypothetical protein
MYQAFDDSWRWRFEVADQVHVRVLAAGRELDR